MTLKSHDPDHCLRRYLEHQSEDAFRALTDHYMDFVYSIAWRRTGGDSGLAQDIVQVVFSDLARKAGVIRDPSRLGGWLHRHTCFVSAAMMRSERRRRIREQEAASMISLKDSSESPWADLAPVLDDAIDRLQPRDRDAILQRFFERRSLREIGQALGVSEDAMQKRMQRALDRLRLLLGRKGVSISSATLAAGLGTHAIQAAPAGLAATLAASGLVSNSTLAASGWAGLTIMKTKLITSGMIVLGGMGIFMLTRSNDRSSPDKGGQEVSQVARAAVPSNAPPPEIQSTELPTLSRPVVTGGIGPEESEPEIAPNGNAHAALSPPVEDANGSVMVSFTAPVQARVGSGQTLITGGWPTHPEKVTFVFVRPETDAASGQVMYRSSFVEIPESLIDELDLAQFKSEGNTSLLKDVIDDPEAALFLETLRQTEGVKFVSAPTIMTLDGRQAKVMVDSSVSLDILGAIEADGHTVEMNIVAELQSESKSAGSGGVADNALQFPEAPLDSGLE